MFRLFLGAIDKVPFFLSFLILKVTTTSFAFYPLFSEAIVNMILVANSTYQNVKVSIS